MNQELENQTFEVPTRSHNTTGIMSIVLGVIALIGCWIPFLNVISMILGIAGIILGICSFISFLRKKCHTCALAIIGAALSVFSVYTSYSITNKVSDTLSDKSETSQKVGEVQGTQESQTTQEIQETQESKQEYKVGDVVAFDNKEFTVTKVEKDYNTNNSFFTPEDGKQFVKVMVKIANKSTSTVDVNPFNFQIKDNNDVIFDACTATFASDDALKTSSLSPNEQIAGSILFEVPKNSSSLKLICKTSFWNNKKIIINL